MAAVDSGAYNNFCADEAGFGLCQWTSSGRKCNLLNYAHAHGKSIGDLGMQLDFLMQELNGAYKGVLNGIKAATTIRQASDIVLTQFERPADQSEAMKQKRASYGQVYFDRYSQSVPFRPYIARITADELNVRSRAEWAGYALIILSR